MSQQSYSFSGTSLDDDLSSPAAPSEPGSTALPQRSIGIAASRPSSSVNPSSSPNAGCSSGSTSTNGGPEASVRRPVFRGALPLNRHANEANYSTPVRHRNFGFLPHYSQVGGDWDRFNSDNGHYRNQPHLWNAPPVVGTNNPGIRMPLQPFIAPYAFMPDQTQPFASYTDGTSPYSYYAPSPPFLETYYAHPSPHLSLQLALKEQIEYYFSVDNLCKDSFLRRNMDARGWVPISLIATFRRVKSVTTNTNYILGALRSSVVIEIQGRNIRRRNDWKRWILPSANGRDGQPSGSIASTSNSSSLQIVTASK